jgi:heat shock protein HslJ
MKKILSYFKSETVYVILIIIILILVGVYLSFVKYSEPKFRIQDSNQIKISQIPDLKNPEYLNKLLAKEWYWSETVIDSSVGIKPYNFSAFKIKFNSDLTFNSTSDCNNIGGSYEVFENKIKLKDIVKTEKYCMKSKETDYVEGLTNASEFLINEKNELILKYKNSNNYMRFK